MCSLETEHILGIDDSVAFASHHADIPGRYLFFSRAVERTVALDR